MMVEIIWYIYAQYIFLCSFYLGTFLVLTSLFGVDTGFHQGYINLLIKLFTWCQYQIEKRQTPKSNSTKRTISNKPFDVYGPQDEVESDSDDLQYIPDNLYKKAVDKIEHQEVEKFKLDRCLNYARLGIMSIVEDEVTQRFDSQHLACWNLLTRTNKSYQFAHPRLAVYFVLGVLFRFFVLFPIRMCIIVFSILFLLISTWLVGLIPEGGIKKTIYRKVAITAFRLMGRGLSIIMTTHQVENRPRSGGICVANHTSPIDVIMLSCDNAYALVGQLQPGILGLMTRALDRATHHVFFDRLQANDRAMVSQALKEHASDMNKLPILIFPEGTCINNSAVMMFKKGAFESSDTIYPVAIKYDQRFGDPFWNSSKDGFASYMLMMMTSWAIVCDVWYLPPMHRKENESAVDFAYRAKTQIAQKGGLVDLDWDGQLKRFKVKPDMRNKLQKLVADKLN